ncbi:MAG: HAMP domain-containing protein [Synergistaceae bacterium]|jgi:two-component system phosphate regulon sensor histidine kinase PhoR|nr:HAMP domain-containing protein [Synergistaceae bacterium]
MSVRTLAGKLTILVILATVLGALSSWLFVARGMRDNIDEITTSILASDTAVFISALDFYSGSAASERIIPQEELFRWSKLLEARITVISGDGTVLADSSVFYEDIWTLDNHKDRPEVRKALAAGFGIDRRYSETTSVPYIYYAATTKARDGSTLIVRCSLPLSRYYALLSGARNNIIAALAFSGLVALSIGIMGVRRVTRPIRELTAASRALRGGLKSSYPTGGALEIEELSRALKESAEVQEKMMNDLQNERNQLQTVVQSAPCGLMLVSWDGLVSCANGVLAPLLRDAPEKITGTSVDGALRAPELIELIAKARGGHDVEMSFISRRLGNERFYNARALSAGENETLLVVDDITERHRMEEARKSFVADAGHELRTPLASISVAAELLRGMEDSGADERAVYIDEIMRQRERMTALVDDLLLLSKLESGVPSSPRRDFDLAELTASQIENAKKNPKAANISWETDLPEKLVFSGGAEELRRSVSNLLDNAVKYTHRRYRDKPGGVISVSLASEGASCVISVADNGVGIPEGEELRIFNRFERIERDRARGNGDSGGYGLGLAIVKTAVASHGGDVTVESENGVTKFVIKLPAQGA